MDLLEKFQDVTKEDVLKVLKTYFLPLLDSKASVAVVVTAPSRADSISKELKAYGFEVERQSLEVDPSELEGSESESDSDSDSEADGR